MYGLCEGFLAGLLPASIAGEGVVWTRDPGGCFGVEPFLRICLDGGAHRRYGIAIPKKANPIFLPNQERVMTHYHTNQYQGLPGAPKQAPEAAGLRIVESLEGLRNGYGAALIDSGDPLEAVQSLLFDIDDLAASARASLCIGGEA